MKEFWIENEHINLNLTSLAQKTIESDCVIFAASSSSTITKSTLINKVITDYNDDFPLDENLIGLKDYESYFKMRLNKQSLDKLDSLGSDSSFTYAQHYSCTQYIKCLLETYARLPFIQRESLILKEGTIEPIKNALAREQMLSIVYKNEKINVSPIGIVPAKEGTFQYLIAMQDASVISIRLSRIQSIKPFGHAVPISNEIKKQTTEALAEYGPTFIKEPVITIKVKFTDDGLKSYEYSVIHRPMHVAIEDNNIYVFRCSEMQAIYFFFRFAGTAEILEPISLRNKFKELYQSGLNNYI